jgi:signal transduction histidine kinase
MVTRIGIAAPAKLLILFLALAGIPLGTLGWLGWRLLEQDRALENQRVHERLDNAAGLLARELDRGLSTWESLLPTLAQGTFVALPPNAVAVRFDAGGVRDHRGVPVPYYPLVPSPPETSGSLFAAGEAYEFRDGALAAAIDLYRRVASTRDGGIRAAALMRLARALRKQRRVNEALAAYGELAAMRDTPVAGSPSELVARRERIGLFTGIGDQKAAEREAEALASALFEGRYRLDRATFDFYRQSTSLEPPDDGAFDVARAIEEFWPTWQQQATGRSAWAGDHGRTWAAVWRRTPNGTAAIVGRADTLLIESLAVVRDAQVRVALHDPSGRVALGAAAADAPHVTKTFRETGLPWDVRVAPADPDLAPQIFASRRNLLTAGLGLMVLVIAAASYFVFRAVNRELAVARLQSDFVATVSHEFRTPLAAMRHLTEMLEDGGVPADRVPRYYRALGKEARRLHAMSKACWTSGAWRPAAAPIEWRRWPPPNWRSRWSASSVNTLHLLRSVSSCRSMIAWTTCASGPTAKRSPWRSGTSWTMRSNTRPTPPPCTCRSTPPTHSPAFPWRTRVLVFRQRSSVTSSASSSEERPRGR